MHRKILTNAGCIDKFVAYEKYVQDLNDVLLNGIKFFKESETELKTSYERKIEELSKELKGYKESSFDSDYLKQMKNLLVFDDSKALEIFQTSPDEALSELRNQIRRSETISLTNKNLENKIADLTAELNLLRSQQIESFNNTVETINNRSRDLDAFGDSISIIEKLESKSKEDYEKINRIEKKVYETQKMFRKYLKYLHKYISDVVSERKKDACSKLLNKKSKDQTVDTGDSSENSLKTHHHRRNLDPFIEYQKHQQDEKNHFEKLLELTSNLRNINLNEIDQI
ncbi:CLUMA_CG000098, isoform A [Clunio marinus]|uniref:CLUMA_CG000098, isoform A n=1 Tax=Clunio marinus TaxID=568069 RepID=A0A1J1HG29_9DIPT|nr:CLUMA_CG000098, isoform A [Clunio marinus]